MFWVCPAGAYAKNGRKEAMKAKIKKADTLPTSQINAQPTRAADSTQSHAAIARETAKLIQKDIRAVPAS